MSSNKKAALWTAAVLSLAGCASTKSGVIADGPDTFSVIQVGKTGFVSSGSLKVAAYRQASAYCAQHGTTMEVISDEEMRGGILGKFPEAHLRFRCKS